MALGHTEVMLIQALQGPHGPRRRLEHIPVPAPHSALLSITLVCSIPPVPSWFTLGILQGPLPLPGTLFPVPLLPSP